MAVTKHLVEQLLEPAPEASARQAADIILSWQERGLIDSVPTMLSAWRAFCEAELPCPSNASDVNEIDGGSC
jgi:hypothetical protein